MWVSTVTGRVCHGAGFHTHGFTTGRIVWVDVTKRKGQFTQITWKTIECRPVALMTSTSAHAAVQFRSSCTKLHQAPFNTKIHEWFPEKSNKNVPKTQCLAAFRWRQGNLWRSEWALRTLSPPPRLNVLEMFLLVGKRLTVSLFVLHTCTKMSTRNLLDIFQSSCLKTTEKKVNFKKMSLIHHLCSHPPQISFASFFPHVQSFHQTNSFSLMFSGIRPCIWFIFPGYGNICLLPLSPKWNEFCLWRSRSWDLFAPLLWDPPTLKKSVQLWC